MLDLQNLIEENILLSKQNSALLETVKILTQENQEILKKIENTMRWDRVWSFLKLIILIAPVILSILYLPDIIKDITGPGGILDLTDLQKQLPISNY